MLNIIRITSRIFFILIFLYFIIKLLIKRYKKRTKKEKKAIEGVMEKDPVCGLYIAVGEAKMVKSSGKLFYFCSEKCRKEFIEKNSG